MQKKVILFQWPKKNACLEKINIILGEKSTYGFSYLVPVTFR